MNLKIPISFLKKFFEYLYYSTLPDCTLWNGESSIILEPICSLRIEDLTIIDYKLIDEWIDESFDITKIRNYMKDEINHADWSELEQVLYSISKNVFELDDNPILYPGERLGKFVSEALPKNPSISKFVDGICHFHPTGDAHFSDIDHQTLKKFANVMENYGKNCIIGLVIAKSDPSEYIIKSRTSKNQFIEYMMKDLTNITFSAKIFYPNKEEKLVNISFI